MGKFHYFIDFWKVCTLEVCTTGWPLRNVHKMDVENREKTTKKCAQIICAQTVCAQNGLFCAQTVCAHFLGGLESVHTCLCTLLGVLKK